MEKTNPNLVLEGDIEFDKRMTPETKAFVKEFEKAFGPLDATSIPLDDMRHGRDKEEKELIESLKFDNLDKPTEIFIKNPVDGYEIPAWVFKPTDAKKERSNRGLLSRRWLDGRFSSNTLPSCIYSSL